MLGQLASVRHVPVLSRGQTQGRGLSGTPVTAPLGPTIERHRVLEIGHAWEMYMCTRLSTLVTTKLGNGAIQTALIIQSTTLAQLDMIIRSE